MASDDQFWRLELDKIVQRIRQDFEAFYGEIYKQMTVYYQMKREEAEVNVQKAISYQQVELEKFTMVQQKWHVEYEKTQTILTYEKEISLKLEHTYSNRIVLRGFFFVWFTDCHFDCLKINWKRNINRLEANMKIAR